MSWEEQIQFQSIPLFPALNNMKKTKKNLWGFTFIEMVIVIGVMIIALPTLYAIFFLTLQQQVRIASLTEVKRQGNFAANTIEALIKRNAISIHSGIPSNTNRICAPPIASTYSSILYFKDKLDKYFYFDTPGDGTKIASESSVTSPTKTDLTSNKVLIYNFSSSCTISSEGFSSPIVTFSFDICYKIGASCGTGLNLATFHFESTITLAPQ